MMRDKEQLRLINRRVVLSGLFGSGLAAASGASQSSSATSPAPKVKDLTATHGMLFGSAFDVFVYDDPAYAQLLRQECQILTSDYSLKFASLRPTADGIRFGSADRLFAFAEKSKLLIRGHNLIWNEFMPDWVKHLSKSEISSLLDRHIDEVAGRYAGRVHSWDVVNEPIWPRHNNADGLRGGPWFDALGPDYIERSFRRARQADPHAKLVLNDAGTEYPGLHSSQRRFYFLKLVKRLLDKGVPLDAVGLESHLWVPDGYGRDPFMTFMGSIQDLGLDIYITELDVNDSDMPDDVGVRDRAVADCYRAYIGDIARIPSVKIIVTWELSDKYTWLSDGIRSGRRPKARWPRPLPFDVNMQPKPAYQAIIDALSKT